MGAVKQAMLRQTAQSQRSARAVAALSTLVTIAQRKMRNVRSVAGRATLQKFAARVGRRKATRDASIVARSGMVLQIAPRVSCATAVAAPTTRSRTALERTRSARSVARRVTLRHIAARHEPADHYTIHASLCLEVNCIGMYTA